MAIRLTSAEAAEQRIFTASSCAMGVFDGVHSGHQYLIGQALKTAHEQGGRCVILTFDIDPDEMFRKDGLKKIMTNEDRLETLMRSGADNVVVLPFTKEFAGLSPDAFLDSTFNGYAPAYLHIGSDFRFGYRASGTVKELHAWGALHRMHVCAHDLKCKDGDPITATRIRKLLQAGGLEEANNLLGYAYYLRAPVVAGRGEGGPMGFATANLRIPSPLHVLGEGVYAAYAIVNGARYKAAVALGVSPTFRDEADAECEVHILDFSQDIYHEEITVEFVKYLRPMMEFDSREHLISVVTANIEWVRNNL